MAVTTVWTQADIETLKVAIASGILSVRYDGPPGRTVTYQTLGDMRKLLAEMIASVNSAAGNHRRFRLAATRKGV
jgi:roadblock/LC7 domain-containing protein